MEDVTDAQRLMNFIDWSAGADACWPWTGMTQNKGYGKLGDRYAHRVMMSVVMDRPLLSTEQVMHRCDNPPCVNPKHLQLGDGLENMRDCVRKKRHGNRYYWLPDDDLLWLFERHVSPDRIALLLGISANPIRRRLRELGCASRPAGRPRDEELAAADRALAEYGMRRRNGAQP